MIRSAIAFTVFLLFFFASEAQPPDRIVEKVGMKWLDLNNHFRSDNDVWGNYTLDFTLEALLTYDTVRHKNNNILLVLDIMNKRNVTPDDTIPYKSQRFCSINFMLGKVTGNEQWYDGYIAESRRMRKEAAFSPEGAVMLNHQDGYYVLIDYMQEYASRMARTGYLTQDTSYFRECVNQFQIYRYILENETTGLWHQGRGWYADKEVLSPGAWSRGHGWLLRGIITSMIWLPEKYRNELMPTLEKVVNSLLSVQDENGMLHILLHLPHEKSVPDVSGTGMMAYYMALGIKNGWLDPKKYKATVLKSTGTVKQYISNEGDISNSSKGPGPLNNIEEYVNYQPELNEKHGFQAIIYAMLGEIMLSN